MTASGYIYGKNSVLALLKHDPKRVSKLFWAEGQKPDRRTNDIYDLAKDNRINIQTVPVAKLRQLVDDPEANIQGVVAVVAAKAFLSLWELIDKAKAKPRNENEYPLLVMLDKVTDPRNLGAILRVIDAVGADGLIISKQNSSGFGSAVAKTASGAETTVDVALTGNLNQAIGELKKGGFWIIGAANEARAQVYTRQAYDMPVVLVMGSEGEGLSQLVAKNCDLLVKIPMRGTVDSLNVATAAAVLLFEMKRGV